MDTQRTRDVPRASKIWRKKQWCWKSEMQWIFLFYHLLLPFLLWMSGRLWLTASLRAVWSINQLTWWISGPLLRRDSWCILRKAWQHIELLLTEPPSVQRGNFSIYPYEYCHAQLRRNKWMHAIQEFASDVFQSKFTALFEIFLQYSIMKSIFLNEKISKSLISGRKRQKWKVVRKPNAQDTSTNLNMVKIWEVIDFLEFWSFYRWTVTHTVSYMMFPFRDCTGQLLSPFPISIRPHSAD